MDALPAGLLDTDLMVLALASGLTEGARVCISRSGDEECTWAGAFDDPLDMYAHGSLQLSGRLRYLWCVNIVDPAWGRNDALWPAVRKALTERPERRYYEK